MSAWSIGGSSMGELTRQLPTGVDRENKPTRRQEHLARFVDPETEFNPRLAGSDAQ